MSAKIFLPTELFYTKEDCDIYGEIQISENNSISYFVVGAVKTIADKRTTTEAELCTRLRHLGNIRKVGAAHQTRDVTLRFEYDNEIPNIYLMSVSIKPPKTAHVNIFLYEKPKILQLHGMENIKASKIGDDNGDEEAEQYDDMHLLCNLLRQSKAAAASSPKKHTLLHFVWAFINFPFDLLTYAFVLLMEWQPIELFLRRFVLYEHYLEWKKFRDTGKRNANIGLDKILGVCVMLMLLLYIPHPGDYLIQASHLIIRELRYLLRALKGSPIGLKLNVHLNNFFLDCFNYHIDLWDTFLNIIEPFVRQLFVPIALLGVMGLSFQMAMLADLIAVMGLHAHCFYIYTAVLYKVEIRGLQVLWKVVLGKRHNILKNRVESHNYMNRQLYLATIFFTALLFLFPTILVYYIVFTTLRLCIYLVNLVLQVKRRRILEFPLQILFKWFTRNFYEKESIQLQFIPHVPSPLLQPDSKQLRMFIFKINVQSSSLARVFSCESGVLQKLTATDKHTSFKSIFNGILEGKF